MQGVVVVGLRGVVNNDVMRRNQFVNEWLVADVPFNKREPVLRQTLYGCQVACIG
ncbi:hypothetical protein AHiyo4_32190 [Arthrobacter sp. Hiyo4]|nr:hypothetical protein AHiyo4_32190 [Arthrobacter sp. Hiyo4]